MASHVEYTNIEEDAQDHVNVEELANFLLDILSKTTNLWESDSTNVNSISSLITSVDRVVSFLRAEAEVVDADQDQWISLAGVFSELLVVLNERELNLSTRPTSTTRLQCSIRHTGEPGRPPLNVPAEMVEDLRGYGFSWQKISEILGISRWTLHRRVREMNLPNLREFSLISNDELDALVKEYINRHGETSGQAYVTGYLRSIGLHIQRQRIRDCMARLNPDNAVLRWGMVVARRRYNVPWPNSLWHLDGHHSLIRWNLVVHGCIDGFSRRIIFLQCSSNNLSNTVLSLFLDAIETDGGLWPSRIRVDKGVENVLVCDAMVEARGEGRGSFIAGPSTHNQRIERLWREVFRCVLHFFYYVFYAMEDAGILFIDNPSHMFALHFVYLPRINQALDEYKEAFNNHGIRTANHWSPNQMWLNGMMNDENPLANDRLDENPQDLQFYGYDPDGPSPFDDTDNNIVVPPVVIEHHLEVLEVFQRLLDPLRPSYEMGIDVYVEALRLIENVLE